MAVDTTILLRGMREYTDALSRHATDLEHEFHTLHGIWSAFSQTYEGSGADHFRAHWQRTEMAFKEYISQSHKIRAILNDRVEALARLDAPNPAL
jgi:uncharacterized protein YukE